MIKVQTFTFNDFQENTYVLFDETKEAVIIDPGCYEKEEREELTSWIELENLKVKQIVNTHCHVDHVLGNEFTKEYYRVKLAIPQLDLPVFHAVKVYAPTYGFVKYHEATPDEFLNEGDKIKFGNSELDVLFVPGHSPGHLAFYSKDSNLIMAGDVLFAGSIGRTDLPGGDFDTLLRSIQNKIFPLGEALVVYPGHGPTTTVGREMRTNPYCALRA